MRVALESEAEYYRKQIQERHMEIAKLENTLRMIEFSLANFGN